MKKEFLFNIALLFVINLLVKLTYLFLVEVNVQNTLGPEQYGLFLALFNFSYLFQFINDPGLQSYNTTSIASNNTSGSDHFSSILGLKVVLALIFLMAVFAGGWLIGYRSAYVSQLLILIAINHILSTLYMLMRSTLSASAYYRQDSWISALDKLLMIAVIGYLLLFHRDSFSLLHFIFGQMISFFIACLVVLVLLINKRIFSFPKVSLNKGKNILHKAAPYALILLLMASYNKMDGVMIERLLPEGDYQAGIYAASLRYMDAANMGAYLFAALLLPMFSSLKNKINEIDELSLIGIRLMMVFVGTVVIIGITYREELMSIYKAFDNQYNVLLALHLISFAAVGISYIYGTLLTATGKLKSMNTILVLGLVINLILNLVLIPRMMATGAAIATLVTQWVVMLGQVALSAKSFTLTIHIKTVISIITFIALSFIIVDQWHNYIPIPWYLSAPIGAIIMLFIAFFLGIVRKDMIFALVK
ncbi:MAG: oligosaccharide flippase family protein [Saprospiraceae bacterium]|nr:oligosaccharide flippase family protein [Saprospiraceae bacterium]